MAVNVTVGKGYSIQFPTGGQAIIPPSGPVKLVVAPSQSPDSVECSLSGLAYIILDAVARTPPGTSSTGSWAAPKLLNGKSDGVLRRLDGPKSDPFYRAVLDLYFRKFPAVIELLSGYNSSDSDSERRAEIAFVLGNAYFEQEKYEAAAHQFYYADYYRPKDPVVLLDYATSLSLAGSDAENDFKRALKSMDPETPENKPLRAMLFSNYGAYLNTLGRYQDAEAELRTALKLEDSLPDREISKAIAHLELAYNREKFSHFVQDEETELNAAARILEGLKDSEIAAVVDYRLADYKTRFGANFHPGEQDPYYNDAQKLFERSCNRLRPNSLASVACRTSFAKLKKQQGKCKEAIEMIKGLDADAPDKTGLPDWDAIKTSMDFVRQECNASAIPK